jgi:tetratricopeptide (TPR) repeat protein
MLDFATDLVRRQRVRNPAITPALRRELANLQEALTWLGDTDDGARLAALLALASSDAPDPGLTAQLVRQAPAEVHTEADALRALAAGMGEWLDSRLPAADRLLTAAVDRLPADHPMRWAALLLRSANSMFAGRRDDVRADALRLLADPTAPGWPRANGVCCAALMDAYAGDAEAGLRWLDEYAAVLDSDVQEGFVPFTRGELLASSAPEQALAWYDLALERCERIDQAYTGNITRVARAAVLIRLGRRDEAISACREAVAAVRDAGMTAQVWTVLRLTAELLGDLGEAQAAAVIVAAADASPYAPVVMGPDRERIARLRAGVAVLPPPPGSGDSTSVAEFALVMLGRHG